MSSQYTYLDDLGYDEEQDKIQTKAEFLKLNLGKPPQNVFSCDGFPYDSVKSFLFIPLYVNPSKRDMYLNEWDSSNPIPPNCTSYDGITPIAPLELNGKTITECAGCSLYGFGRNFRCKDAPVIMGLAYFPELGDTLVPIKKTIPSTSTKAVNQLAASLNRPVIVGANLRQLKIFTRIIRVSSVAATSGNYNISKFVFDLIAPPLPGQPPSSDPPFVPEHLIEQIQKMFGMAKGLVAQYQTPQIAGATIPLIQNNPYGVSTEDTQFAATVMSEEEEAGY